MPTLFFKTVRYKCQMNLHFTLTSPNFSLKTLSLIHSYIRTQLTHYSNKYTLIPDPHNTQTFNSYPYFYSHSNTLSLMIFHTVTVPNIIIIIAITCYNYLQPYSLIRCKYNIYFIFIMINKYVTSKQFLKIR